MPPPDPFPMTRTYLVAGGALLVAALVCIHWMSTQPEFDADLTEAFQRASEVYAYTQEDITETVISDRTLHIEGLYHNNTRAGRFWSIATTTIVIPDDGEHEFSLANISFGDEVYTRVVTESPILREQIAFDAAWHRFRRDAIPTEFQNIAISGPILDHLALFSDGGKHLDLVEGPLTETATSSERVYVFRLALGARSEAGGTLATLMERIGDGSIRVWIDSEHLIRRIAIHDELFHSTTTLSRFNEPAVIEAPQMNE